MPSPWLACYGAAPETGYLGGGPVDVTPRLSVPGYQNVFAIGDITALPDLYVRVWRKNPKIWAYVCVPVG